MACLVASSAAQSEDKSRSAKDTPVGPSLNATSTRKIKLMQELQTLDTIIESIPSSNDKEPKLKEGVEQVKVIVGTSSLAENNTALLSSIASMANRAYGHRRLSSSEVRDRLAMGDSGLRANRVLHLAYLGETIVGCMSSTFQPPWTEDGCGHWGLLVVDPDYQGRGIASQLVAAAERRLAGACDQIQIEYEYTSGEEYSERLLKWYEGSCGFTCVSGYGRGFGGTQFRKCRKQISREAAQRGKRDRLMQIREELVMKLATEGDEAPRSSFQPPSRRPAKPQVMEDDDEDLDEDDDESDNDSSSDADVMIT